MSKPNDGDNCPERDSDGDCNCKRETHPRLLVERAPRYPQG